MVENKILSNKIRKRKGKNIENKQMSILDSEIKEIQLLTDLDKCYIGCSVIVKDFYLMYNVKIYKSDIKSQESLALT